MSRGKPPGSSVVLTYDSDADIEIEDVIRSNGGSLYFVDEILSISDWRSRLSWSFRHYRLRCTKLDPDTFAGDADHELYWYPRHRRRPR